METVDIWKKEMEKGEFPSLFVFSAFGLREDHSWLHGAAKMSIENQVFLAWRIREQSLRQL